MNFLNRMIQTLVPKAVVIGLLATIGGTTARAEWWGPGRDRREREHWEYHGRSLVIDVLPREAVRVVLDGLVYYRHHGVFYRAVEGGYMMVPSPAVRVLPPGYEVVNVGGARYYRSGGIYYAAGNVGYVVVNPPTMVVTAPVPVMTARPSPAPVSHASGDVLMINVPNKSGTAYVPVALHERNGGYVGPRGEFYPAMPSVRQLSDMYGGN